MELKYIYSYLAMELKYKKYHVPLTVWPMAICTCALCTVGK